MRAYAEHEAQLCLIADRAANIKLPRAYMKFVSTTLRLSKEYPFRWHLLTVLCRDECWRLRADGRRLCALAGYREPG